MSVQVEAAVDALEKFSPASADAIDQLFAATDVLELALNDLRLVSEAQFVVSDQGTVPGLYDHVNRSRVLADAFDLAATRFHNTQDETKAMVPRVFGDYPAGFVGPTPPGKPSARGEDDKKGRKWLADRLLAASGKTPSEAARTFEVNYRRALGMVDGTPFVIAVHDHVLWVAGEGPVLPGVSLGAGFEQRWTITELSDGSALATLSVDRSAGVTVATKGDHLGILVGDYRLEIDQRTGMSLGAGTTQTRTQRFASVAEANDAMNKGQLAGFDLYLGGVLGAFAPPLGALVEHEPGVMHDAPLTSRTLEVSGSIQTPVPGSDGLGGALQETGEARIVVERDRDAATTTDVLGVSAELAAPGLLGLTGANTASSVAVTRQDGNGAAQTLTARLSFDAPAGLQPQLGAPVDLVGPAATADGPSHRYDVTVEVDLTDPANHTLADGLSTTGSPAARLDEDLRALARARDLNTDVLARSRITVLEQEVQQPSGLSETGLSLEGGMVNTNVVTVKAWQNVDGQMLAK